MVRVQPFHLTADDDQIGQIERVLCSYRYAQRPKIGLTWLSPELVPEFSRHIDQYPAVLATGVGQRHHLAFYILTGKFGLPIDLEILLRRNVSLGQRGHE